MWLKNRSQFFADGPCHFDKWRLLDEPQPDREPFIQYCRDTQGRTCCTASWDYRHDDRGSPVVPAGAPRVVVEVDDWARRDLLSYCHARIDELNAELNDEDEDEDWPEPLNHDLEVMWNTAVAQDLRSARGGHRGGWIVKDQANWKFDSFDALIYWAEFFYDYYTDEVPGVKELMEVTGGLGVEEFREFAFIEMGRKRDAFRLPRVLRLRDCVFKME